jgi:hypothetical protein
MEGVHPIDDFGVIQGITRNGPTKPNHIKLTKRLVSAKLTINFELTHAPGDEVAVLGAEVKDGNLRVP